MKGLIDKPVADIAALLLQGVLVIDVVIFQPEAVVPLLYELIPSPLLLIDGDELLKVGLFLSAEVQSMQDFRSGLLFLGSFQHLMETRQLRFILHKIVIELQQIFRI